MTDTKSSAKESESQPNLNPNAPSFVPKFLKKSVPSTQEISGLDNSSSSQPQFNIDAPVFKPNKTSAAYSSNINANGSQSSEYMDTYSNAQSSLLQSSIQGGPYSVLSGNIDPLNGYVNPFIASKSSTAMAQKKLQNQKEEQRKRLYPIEFMMSLRNQNRDRPPNMALMDFPHKRKRQIRSNQMSEADKFNLTVRELRILLNKLSKDNFETVTKSILHDYAFTPSLLNELMKIIFMKATTEEAYLEYYVKLCILLFKKYNDKENKEMNFKKLLLMKCQKQFYKMQEKEEQERRSRRQSQAEGDNQSSNPKAPDEEIFNKQMLYVFDKEEIKFRLRQQLFGNMRLIVVLYLHNQIPEGIILTCIQTLLEDINDQSVEILCNMLQKIAAHVVNRATQESQVNKDAPSSVHGGSGKKPKRSLSSCQINLDYVETTLTQLFSYRKAEILSSRIRFKIQDLIEEYQKDWKCVIFGERNMVDSEGFQYKYVPKDSIITEEVYKPGSRKASGRKQVETNSYIYVKKQKNGSSSVSENSSANKSEAVKNVNTLKNLLSNLQPDTMNGVQLEDSSEDEEVRKIMSRKVSMNEQNVIGTNFEKYNDQKPSQEIRRKIANYFLEYKENYDIISAKTSFLDICQETSIPHHIFVGYILHNAFSQDASGWKDIFGLIIDHLFLKEKLFTEKEFLEGVHVSLANFIDTMIDYPNAKEYSFDMFEKLGEVGILSKEMIEKYRKHVENLQCEDLDY